MIENKNIDFIDEEQFLTDFFAMESESELIDDVRKIYAAESSFINQDFINKTVEFCSTESWKDKITYHSSRIKIMIKNLINDIIKYVLDLLGLGSNNKKVLLFVSKKLKEAYKSLMATFNKRMERGPYNFEDKPIEIKNIFYTIWRPVVILLYISIVLSMSTEMLNDKGIADADTGITLNQTQANNISNEDIQKMDKFLESLQVEITRCLVMIFMLSQIEKFGASKYGNDNHITRDVILLNRNQFKSLLGATKDPHFSHRKFFSDLDEIIGGLIGSTMFTDSQKFCGNNYGTKTLTEVYNRDNLEELRSLIDNAKDQFADTMDDLKETSSDEILEIDSNNIFTYNILGVIGSMPTLAEIGKNIDFKKSLDNMKKRIDKLQKDLNKMNETCSNILIDNFHILEFLSFASMSYLTAKNMVNRSADICIRLIDDGVTELKKLESIIA